MSKTQERSKYQYWCPEHGDDSLVGICEEEQWVDLDRNGQVMRVREGNTEMKSVWCAQCGRIFLEPDQRARPVYRILVSDIQSYAEGGYGRSLADEELERVTKGLEHALGEFDVIGELVSMIMVETNTEPL